MKNIIHTVRIRTQKLIQLIRSRAGKRVVFVLAGAFVLGIGVSMYYPRTIEFSYAGANCIGALTVLPKVQQSTSERKELRIEKTWDIAGYPIMGREVCAEPLDAPTEGVELAGIAPWGVAFPQQLFRVNVPEAPIVNVEVLKRPMPATRALEVPLSEEDSTFDYALVNTEHRAECELNGGGMLDCDLPALELQQGKRHHVALERSFKGEVIATLADEEIEVLPAVTVEATSVDQGQTVYEKPREFMVRTDKELVNAEVALQRNGADAPVDADARVDGRHVQVVLNNEDDLPRDETYTLTVLEAEAEDGSTLTDPYEVEFRLSDGPRVTGVNIGGSGVDPGATVVISLDQPLAADQNIDDFIEISGLDARISAGDQQIYVQLQGAPRCVEFRIELSEGLISEHDVEATSGWSHVARTSCYTVETIGVSVNGAPINAYFFGNNGGRTLLFTGGIHGNELSSLYTMRTFIDELESNPGRIPNDKQIVIVPNANPDGTAVARRDNSNNVNLNRNFPTTNWEKDITIGGGATHPGGGGPSGGSEPETQALINLTHRLSPYLVVTYHSLGSLVNSNGIGAADSAGQAYASQVGYRFVPAGNTEAAFGFTMTGTYELWLQERGTPAILLELPSHTANFFYTNAPAIWQLVGG